jgi:pyruvate formate lyase activating enzyme
MDIKGFMESSLLEWEGNIASVVFLPRCNMRCRYCHAGHLIINPDAHENIARQDVFDYLRGQVGWIDGVVVTGGEPLLHGEELAGLLREVRAIPLKAMVETNGTRPEWLARLLGEGLLDAASMDLKAPLTPEDYRRVTPTEVDVADIRASLRIILNSPLEHEFRITLVPGIVGEEELARMGPEIQGAQRIALQNFKAELCLDEELRRVRPYSPDEMDAFAELMEPFAQRVIVRGRENALGADVGP